MTLHEKEFLSQEASKITGKLVIKLESLSKKFLELNLESFETIKNSIQQDIQSLLSIYNKAIIQ